MSTIKVVELGRVSQETLGGKGSFEAGNTQQD